MITSRELKQIEVNNKDFTYLENTLDNGLVYPTTTFIQFKIPENYEELFQSIGGYSRQVLLNPTKEVVADTITIVSTMEEDSELGIYILFEKDEDIVKELLSLSGIFLPYIIRFVKDNKESLGNVNWGNSLLYVEHEKYGGYLKDYKAPKSILDSGIHYGEETIHFGDTFKVHGLQNIQDILLGDLLKIVQTDNINTLVVKVGSQEGAFGTIIDGYLEKENGKPYTCLDWLKVIEDKTTEEHYAEYVEGALVSINRRIERFKKKLVRSEGEYTPKQLETEVNNYKERIGYDAEVEALKKDAMIELEEPYQAIVSKSGINTLLNKKEVTFEKVN